MRVKLSHRRVTAESPTTPSASPEHLPLSHLPRPPNASPPRYRYVLDGRAVSLDGDSLVPLLTRPTQREYLPAREDGGGGGGEGRSGGLVVGGDASSWSRWCECSQAAAPAPSHIHSRLLAPPLPLIHSRLLAHPLPFTADASRPCPLIHKHVRSVLSFTAPALSFTGTCAPSCTRTFGVTASTTHSRARPP